MCVTFVSDQDLAKSRLILILLLDPESGDFKLHKKNDGGDKIWKIPNCVHSDLTVNRSFFVLGMFNLHFWNPYKKLVPKMESNQHFT